MTILYRAIFWVPFALTIAIFLMLFYLEVFKKKIKIHQAKEATCVILIVYLAQFVFKSLYFYFYNRGTELGQYLLKVPGYISKNVWYMFQNYLGSLLTGFIVLLAAIIASKITKRPFFEKPDFWIIFVASFVAGFPGVMVMILGALVLMLLAQIYLIAIKKSHQRLSLTPFLLLSVIIVGILNSFSFYIHFLQSLKLI